jgi:CheY-like chemotaxis protein
MAPQRILIVEDERIIGEDVRRRLESWGYDVPAVVTSGEEAIRLAEKHHPDLLLMDIRLRGRMDGVESARRIQEQSNVPVVFATASSDAPSMARASAANPLGFISKPFDDNEMRTVIAKALCRRNIDGSPVQTNGTPVRKSATRMPRVLVADDNSVNRLVARTMLEKLGCFVHAVESGLEAVEAFGKAPFDVVLMDCHMPHMDGYEAANTIRAKEAKGGHTVIIAMTADNLPEDRKRCHDVGMDDFLPKPVRLDQMRAVLEKWI